MRAFWAVALQLLCIGGSWARRVHVDGRQLIVEGEPFQVRGLCYSPTPVNESVYFAPYGDYFTAAYSFIWLRDLPLVKAMGVNVVRTYGWQTTNDHTAFLDAAAANGLYVMATYYMGEAVETPVTTAADRKKAVAGFQREVAKYASHSSLLFWSFGNELNGVWNGYLTQLGEDPEQPPCKWDERYDDLGGCWIHKRPHPWPPGHPCYEAGYCVYKRLFSFINDAAVAAKEAADVLVVSGFADVDNLYEKVGRTGEFAENLDAWTAQVYRGSTFGDFFEAMANNTDKPVLLTEYGVDAYHDACGTGLHTPCFNTAADTLAEPDENRTGSWVDETSQAIFAINLTAEIDAVSSRLPECHGANRNTAHGKCSCIGGFLMSWTDEFWKGAKSQAKCEPTIDHEMFNTRKCTAKAHVTCGNWDAEFHDLCGYWLEAAPDHYVNEEWFGITTPTQCEHSINSLQPRETYWKMRKHWTGHGIDHDLFDNCTDLVNGHCVALGDGGGGGGLLATLFGQGQPPEGTVLREPCSGRGSCTTDWRECGAGTDSEVATPCCNCHWGFAGPGCSEVDARIYLAVGGVGLLVGLLVLMLATSAMAAVRRARLNSLEEPLLS